MSYSRFLKLTDLTGSPNYVGSALWNGSPIYTYSYEVTINGTNHIQQRQLSCASANIITEDSTSLKTNWNRRKAYNTYTGAGNLVINISGNWEPEQVGSFDSGGNLLLSPHKIMRMALSDHRFYLWDNVMIGSLTSGELASGTIGDFEAGSSYYGSDGIPVVIKDWNMTRNSDRPELIQWSILFWEDKT